MDNIAKVIILSLIEGITEFLPVSSTGHLIIGTAALDFAIAGTVFEIFIQVGAVVAVIFYYRQTLLRQAGQVRSHPPTRRFWLLILLAAVPAAGLGFLFGEPMQAFLFSPVVVAVSLIAGGIAFLLVEQLPSFRKVRHGKTDRMTDITLSQALTVGLVQVLALIPGMSRSGSSIIGGMLAGMNRQTATEFSFFLAIPVLGGATVYKLLISLDALRPDELMLLLLGAALSGLFAWFAIDWLLKFISGSSFAVFGYYRIAAGLAILAFAANGSIS